MGERGAGHEVSILKRLAVFGLPGRMPSKVSMTIIKPPQHGQQHMREEATDELAGVERHGLEPVAAFAAVVLRFERDARVVEREQARVGDRDAL